MSGAVLWLAWSAKTIEAYVHNAEYAVRMAPWLWTAGSLILLIIAVWSSGIVARVVWIALAAFVVALVIGLNGPGYPMMVPFSPNVIAFLLLWTGGPWLVFAGRVELHRWRARRQPPGFASPVSPGGHVPAGHSVDAPGMPQAPDSTWVRVVAGLSIVAIAFIVDGVVAPMVSDRIDNDVNLRWREAGVLASRIDERFYIARMDGIVVGAFDGAIAELPPAVGNPMRALFTTDYPVPTWFRPEDVRIRCTGPALDEFEITITGGSVPGAPTGSRTWQCGEAAWTYAEPD